MVDPVQDGLLREIDDEIRHEQYLKLWSRYGSWVIGVVVCLVLVVAGYQIWRNLDLKARQEQGVRFEQALDLAMADKPKDAADAFGAMVAMSGRGYATLARLQEAGLQASAGDRVAAAATFRQLSTESGVAPIYRDLAVLVGVGLEMDEAGADRADLLRRLEPLTVDANPWRFSARELSALLIHAGGDSTKAKGILESLTKDVQAPRGIRERAERVLSMIGS